MEELITSYRDAPSVDILTVNSPTLKIRFSRCRAITTVAEPAIQQQVVSNIEEIVSDKVGTVIFGDDDKIPFFPVGSYVETGQSLGVIRFIYSGPPVIDSKGITRRMGIGKTPLRGLLAELGHIVDAEFGAQGVTGYCLKTIWKELAKLYRQKQLNGESLRATLKKYEPPFDGILDQRAVLSTGDVVLDVYKQIHVPSGGRIVQYHVENKSPVEFNQAIMSIDKAAPKPPQ
ncbi:MAG: hypothetical protein V1735_00200 [Nanoarchaeota archaeon]